MNLVERADGLQHHPQRLTRRRAVVVGSRRDRLVEEDRRAAGGTPRVGVVPDAEAAHVGQAAGRCQRRALHLREHWTGAGDKGRAAQPANKISAGNGESVHIIPYGDAGKLTLCMTVMSHVPPSFVMTKFSMPFLNGMS